jgi:YebC/PmpR family DNA-binding regulatory protein
MYVEVLTDNKNRAVGEVRHVLTRYGGNLGSSGCVSFLFEKRGLISFDREGLDGDALLEAALEAGADDVVEGEDAVDVVVAPGDLEATRGALEERGFTPASAGISMEPTSTVRLDGKDAESMLRLTDALEELDDVQGVSANFDIPEEEMARLVG